MVLLSNIAFVHTAANIATLLFGMMMIAQILIGIGVLPISIVWGGRQKVLTPALRIASFAAVLILGLFAYLIRYRAGLVGSPPIPTVVSIGAWVVTAYMALNTVGNLAGTSKTEKFLFGSMTLVLMITCLIVSLSTIN